MRGAGAYHGEMNRRVFVGVLGCVVLLGGGLLIERVLVSDEERVERAYDRLRSAVQDESSTGLQAMLTDDFSFSGPQPVGTGDRAGVVARFEEFWGLADRVGLLPRGSKEIAVAGGIATLRIPQIVRFHYGDQFIAYRVDAVLTFDRIGDEFVLAQIEVTDLRPGIL